MSFMGAFGSNDGTEQRAGAPLQTSSSHQHIEQEIAHKTSEATTLATTRSRSPSRLHTAPDTKATEAADDEKNDSEDSDSQSDEARFRQVTSLARQYTNASHYSAIGKNPFTEAEPDSSLDPNGSNFNARAWAKALLHVQSRDPEKHPERTAGIAYKNLNVFGYGNATDYQKSVGNVLIDIPGLVNQALGKGQRRIDILRDFEGLVEAGEMLVVLGPPGSGCSTLLKTIAGETHGFNIDKDSYINYQGISAHDMHNQFRGEAIYTAEVDVHFPNMTVGDTLAFAARARAPRNTPGDVDPWTYANHMRDVVMAMYGITHTINTRVGNDFVRGVSGGERKRVSIAEATLSQAPLQCWDNSTRGLDSANAIEFCKTLRMQTDLMGCTACVAIYQAPQAAFDTFDKVAVLYEGRQIYFGRCEEARQYFIDMGFECPDRQTTADFLTSMTSAIERVVRPGWENRVPRTPDEFAARWKESQARAQLLKDIDEYNTKYAIGGEYLEKFKQSRKTQQSKRQRINSPYTLSYSGQVKLCLWRGFRRLVGDPSLTISQIFGNTVMALILGSVFYNLPDNASSFYSRGALLFFAVLFNAFGSALEILTLYAQRPIVEKHARYAMYHPSAEAVASMLTDMPYKIGNAICFNLILYFMTNLRREPGAFFFFILISFVLTLVMSMLFRTIGSVSRTLSQAMAPTAVLILALVIYTGFVIPTRYMLGWSRWINYLDPISYGFESLMINEFHNRNFTCTTFVPDRSVPGYENIGPLNQVCSSTGSQPGQDYVDGDAFINSSYAYYHSHKWRNLGIEFVFMIGLCCAYLAATEFISAKKSKGEVLVFRRGYVPATAKTTDDIESTPAGRAPISEKTDNSGAIIQRQTAIFHWEDMCYDIKIKNEERRILDHVDGWVKPGTLTALMGVSGAGKTTLLDVLATRVTMGVISGNAMVDGRERDDSFQRKTGYVQQQDLHLQTSTVREALNFSALLRQPANVSREEKLAYVDEVIKLLDMQEYADAVVGVPGEGLNVEQRKRLTIGVELAAKPQLLLFLDEPTSGLDSQTSWAICDLMEKLTNNGQAILCTIHQPSAMLFQRFDRLLFLAKGGRTVYFGDIGKNSKVLTSYFERNGAFPCPDEANPAEWMLEVIGAAPGSHTEIDWHQAWRNSAEYQGVKDELRRMKEELPQQTQPSSSDEKASFREFAAPFGFQLWEVTKRVFEQYWRTPSYIYSKLVLVVASGLFVGFSFFKAQNTQQGLQNQMFAIFMLMTIFGNLVQQIMPHFVTQRALYEVRERPSKTYSWKAFMLSQIIVELPWNTLAAILLFFTWYYPIGLYRNSEPTGTVDERGALMFLFIWVFLMFTSTFTDMVIAGIETAENGGNIANLLFMLTLIFCGVLATKEALPGFWIFMYYMSPFTYLVSGMLSTAVSNTDAECASNEYLHFEPTDNQTCAQYMEVFQMATGGGYTLNPEATSDCQYCAISSTNQFLAQVDISFDTAWRNFGIMWVYVFFNVAAALFIYWLGRVPKKPSKKKQA